MIGIKYRRKPFLGHPNVDFETVSQCDIWATQKYLIHGRLLLQSCIIITIFQAGVPPVLVSKRFVRKCNKNVMWNLQKNVYILKRVMWFPSLSPLARLVSEAKCEPSTWISRECGVRWPGLQISRLQCRADRRTAGLAEVQTSAAGTRTWCRSPESRYCPNSLKIGRYMYINEFSKETSS